MKRMAYGSMALAFGALAVGAGSVRAQQAAAAPAAQQQDSRPGIAVLDFTVQPVQVADREGEMALGPGLAAIALTELTAYQSVRVVERSQLQQILQEQNLGREGRTDPQTLSRIGKLIGARYMVTGNLLDLRGDLRLDVRVFNTETSEVEKAEQIRGRMDRIYDMLPELARRVIQDAHLPPLERQAMEEFRQANPVPPTSAVMAYSRAVLFQDRGDRAQAVEQYKRAVNIFPQYTQAKAACNALQAGACG